jgi:hypothetical protein
VVRPNKRDGFTCRVGRLGPPNRKGELEIVRNLHGALLESDGQ